MQLKQTHTLKILGKKSSHLFLYPLICVMICMVDMLSLMFPCVIIWFTPPAAHMPALVIWFVPPVALLYLNPVWFPVHCQAVVCATQYEA